MTSYSAYWRIFLIYLIKKRIFADATWISRRNICEDISSNGEPLALLAVAAEKQQEAAVEEVFGGFAGSGRKGDRLK